MKKKIFKSTIFIILAGLFICSFAIAQNAENSSLMEKQLLEILRAQKSIQQRLIAIESQQKNILNSIQSRKGNQKGAGVAKAARPAQDPNKVYKIDIGDSLVLGDKDGKVTIVEFSDFQCPYSQKFHAIIPQVLKAYPKGVKFVFKNFPLSFHPQAKPAAKAALAAREQGKFWEMLELLFQNGRNLNEAKYEELAKQLGLNVKKFLKDYKEKDAEWEKLIQEDVAVASSVGVRGTPTFYINGKTTRARDLQSFKAEIDNILKSN